MSGDPVTPEPSTRPPDSGEPEVRGEDAPSLEDGPSVEDEPSAGDGPTPEPEPRRRRVRLSYRSADRSMMADQVLILMALVVAVFMVYSRGCRTSFDGLAKVLTEEAPPAGAGGEEVDGSPGQERRPD